MTPRQRFLVGVLPVLLAWLLAGALNRALGLSALASFGLFAVLAVLGHGLLWRSTRRGEVTWLGPYADGWVTWSRRWRWQHWLAVGASAGIVTAGAALLEVSTPLGVLVFASGALLLGLTPLGDAPFFGATEQSPGFLASGRDVLAAHREGKRRVQVEREKRHGRRFYS